jgi:ABC-type glycerol-3-phosphate transport system substrate-binding protein
MNVASERQEAAWKAMKWLFRPEIQAQWNVNMGMAAAACSAVAPAVS